MLRGHGIAVGCGRSAAHDGEATKRSVPRRLGLTA